MLAGFDAGRLPERGHGSDVRRKRSLICLKFFRVSVPDFSKHVCLLVQGPLSRNS